MNFLIAYLDSEYQKVLSDDSTIVTSFQLNNHHIIDYKSGYKLDDDQLFQLNDFSESDYFTNVCQSEFGTAALNQISNGSYDDISHICVIQDSKNIFNE